MPIISVSDLLHGHMQIYSYFDLLYLLKFNYIK